MYWPIQRDLNQYLAEQERDEAFSDAIEEKVSEIFDGVFLCDVYDKLSPSAQAEIDEQLKKLADPVVEQAMEDERWEAINNRFDYQGYSA